MPVCQLCLIDKPLIKKSHIIPDGMYNMLYDDKHKIYRFAPADLLKDNPRIQRPSTGIYEGGLLCKECDGNIIGRYESYGIRVMYAKAEIDPLPPEWTPRVKNGWSQHGQKISQVENIDYGKFKLFLLSILWRASISTRPEFSEVSLGQMHSENIRKMIFEGDPGDVTDYPISIQSYATEDTAKDIIIQPRKRRTEDYTSYIFAITGYFYVFHITQGKTLPDSILGGVLHPNGTFTVLHVEDGSGMKHLMKLASV